MFVVAFIMAWPCERVLNKQFIEVLRREAAAKKSPPSKPEGNWWDDDELLASADGPVIEHESA